MSRPKFIGPLPKCSFDPCNRQSKTRLLCDAHYQQLRKTGNMKPIAYGRFNDLSLEDLMFYTIRAGTCRVWTRSQTSSGYGYQTYRGRSWPAHRLAYYLANDAPDLKGVVIHHKCANKLCVNIEHLEPASQADNVLEMFARTSLEAELTIAKQKIIELEAEVEILKGKGVTILR